MKKTHLIRVVCAVLMLAVVAQTAVARPPEREGGENGERQGPFRMMEQLREENPGEFERLTELRKENPEAFREEVHRLMESRRDKFSKMRGVQGDKVDDLVKAYHDAEGDQERDKIRAALRAELKRLFDERYARHEKALDAMSERLAEMREHLEERRENRERIIDHKLESLTLDPTLRW
jgi:hypothetical protein